jgi:hypothetical protein
MIHYKAIFDVLTERQRSVMARLADDDVTALDDKTTVAELTDLGLVYEALDESANVPALFMTHRIQIAWRDWQAEHLTAEDIANADTDATAFLARAEASAEPPAAVAVEPLPPNINRRRPGRPRKAKS